MLYFSGGGPTIPWINTKVWDETKDEQQSTGWCPTVLDTNGDGKITKPWNEPVGGGRSQNEGGGGGQLGKFDPKLDTRVNAGSYGIIVSPTDNSVWGAGDGYPGRFIRLELGKNPPETCMAEMYTIPDDKAETALRARAGSTSIATASSGRRCRAAAASPASTAGSARCSTARRSPTASSARRAGRSIR